ncbi:MAG: glycosyltransferase family 4 protein [Rubricoccaceae bacterium]|nr:glycosyltransferase family 4 protein [Rubricoccaceae bacterium]
MHNYYQFSGGEDQVFRAEGELLRENGHAVFTYTVDNDEVEAMSLPVLGAKTLWSREASAEIGQVVQEEKIDVVHFHNTLPLVSPAGYWAARRGGAAVVQTLHNYRTICPGTLLHRDGASCEKCVGKAFAASALVHKCYRGSRSATAAVAAMTAVHRMVGTWDQAVDRYIAITEFAREKFIRGGLPQEKLAVKPNFLKSDPGPGSGKGGFALFAGRLDGAKGVQVLLDAWQADHEKKLPKLVIAGDGELACDVDAAQVDGRIEWLGWKSHEEVLGLMHDASILLFPSQVYEGGTPMSLVEAFATGLPVVASDIGTISTMIQSGKNGVLVESGNPVALAEAVKETLANTEALAEMGKEARHTFEEYYGAERNYRLLTDIYQQAIKTRRAEEAYA